MQYKLHDSYIAKKITWSFIIFYTLQIPVKFAESRTTFLVTLFTKSTEVTVEYFSIIRQFPIKIID